MTIESSRQSATDLARANLSKCAREVLHWRRKATLPDDATLRLVAAALDSTFDDALHQAEDLVVRLALEAAAARS